MKMKKIKYNLRKINSKKIKNQKKEKKKQEKLRKKFRVKGRVIKFGQLGVLFFKKIRFFYQ